MECACVYVDSEDAGAKVETIKIVSARKIHKCGECRREIKPGEKYEKVTGLWEGAWSTYKTCQDCLSIRDEFFCEGWFYEMIHEYLNEHIRESSGQISSDCILSLTPAAQDIVFNMIEDCWKNMGDE